MTNRIHTAVEGVQAPGRDPPLNRSAPQTQRRQLPPRYDTVLPPGELRDLPVGSPMAPTVAAKRAQECADARGGVSIRRSYAAQGGHPGGEQRARVLRSDVVVQPLVIG